CTSRASPAHRLSGSTVAHRLKRYSATLSFTITGQTSYHHKEQNRRGFRIEQRGERTVSERIPERDWQELLNQLSFRINQRSAEILSAETQAGIAATGIQHKAMECRV
ncbi:MAG: hypothetical protein KJ626_12635, partial [Verrucomicrobia bacterium]|nr:hypothetical protein [Verrucomicrobiota bacterium]